jgi:hypothetical protein
MSSFTSKRVLILKTMFLPDFGFSKSRKTKVIMEVMQMKCRVCGKSTSELSGWYCLRCEKIAADVEAELAMGCEQQ